MKAVVRTVVRALFYAGTIVLFMLVAIAGFTQTKTFRSYLQSIIVASYPQIINGTLRVASIEGNLVTGLQLANVVLEDSLTRVLSVDRIDIRYDLLGLIFQRASLSKLTLINPEIHIYRTLHHAWNIAGIAKRSSDDTATSPWYLEAKQIELINARISITDSVRLRDRALGKEPSPSASRLDYARLRIERLNATVAMQIFQKRNYFQIKKLNFESVSPSIRVVQLIGEALIAPHETALKKFRIETNRSLVFLNASMQEGNFAKLSDPQVLKTTPLSLDINALRLSTAELKQCVYPWVDVLNGDVSLRVTVSGTLNRLIVEQAMVQTPDTYLQVQGGVSRLLDGDSLSMDLYCNDNRLAPSDLSLYLPGIALPDIRSTGPITFSLDVSGTPTDFTTHVRGDARAGNVNITAAIKQHKRVLSYDIDARLARLDLGLLLNDAELASSLNGTVKLNGSGTTLSSMIAVARAELDTSLFYKLPLQRGVIVVDAAQGILTSRVALNWRSTQVDAAGKLDTRSASSVLYDVTGRINSLDLQDLFRDKNLESDLSGSFSAAGDAGTTDASVDTLELHLSRSSFGTTVFEGGIAKARYETMENRRRTFSFVSPPVKVEVEGTFTPASVLLTLQNGVQTVVASVKYRVDNLDSLRSFGKKIEPRILPRVSALRFADTVAYSLRMNWDDLSALGVLLHHPMGGQATVDATVRGHSEDLTIGGSASAPFIWYGDGTDSIRSSNFAADLSASKISPLSAVETPDLRLVARADLFSFGQNRFNDLRLSGSFAADTGSVAASALIDSTVTIEVRGSLRSRMRLLEVDVADLRAVLGQYTFVNKERAFLTLGKDGIQITRLGLKRDLEEISVSGFFNPNGISDVSLAAKGLQLNKYFIQSTPLASAFNDIRGTLYANASLRGSFDHPNFSVEASVDGLRYTRSSWSEQENKMVDYERSLGRLDSRLNYFEHNLGVFVRLVRAAESSSGVPDALISGSLPFELAMAKEQPHTLTGSMNLQMQVNNFDLQLIAPFIPVVSNLQGKLSCDMKLFGAIDKPQYSGFASIDRATFVFDPVGIRYQMDGKLVPSGERIQLQNMVIRNADNADRAMNVSGTIGLLGLRLNDFDLRLDGSLEVMREEFRKAGGKFYGDLYVSSGTNGLRWKGSLDQSLASGEVVVNSARLTFPPEREVAGFTARSIDVKFVDDTTKAPSSKKEPVAASVAPKQTVVRANGTATPTTKPADNRTFLDRISYDLGIQVSEQTKVRFVFSTQTSEELYAALRGRLGFIKNAGGIRVSGELAVGEGSYYYQIKKFNASGSLLFTGDPLNPELNIVAQYTGTHQADTTSLTAGTQSGVERVTVILNITENRSAPNTKITLDVQASDGKKISRPDAESDALSFIVTGKWKDELTQQQNEAFTLSSYGLAAGALTGPLSSVLRERTRGYVQSVDVAYYGSSSGSFGEKADVRLTGQIGDAVIRAGGKVLNDPSKTNVSVEFPISSLVNNDRLRNLILTLERKVDDRGDITEQRRAATNGAKLFYRFTF